MAILNEEQKQAERLREQKENKKIFDYAIKFLITDRLKNGRAITKEIYKNYRNEREQAVYIQGGDFAEYLIAYLYGEKNLVEINLLALTGLGIIGRFVESPSELTDKAIGLYLTLIRNKKNKFKFLSILLPKI